MQSARLAPTLPVDCTILLMLLHLQGCEQPYGTSRKLKLAITRLPIQDCPDDKEARHALAQQRSRTRSPLSFAFPAT